LDLPRAPPGTVTESAWEMRDLISQLAGPQDLQMCLPFFRLGDGTLKGVELSDREWYSLAG